ncbi:MAG TPA: response regulator transcription factor [Solirubrobacterales bacterium]|nr:response regulator transcription factor [Solirubrobacterales bacterium]
MAAEPKSTDESGAITIILADDHEIVRDGLRRIVEAEGDMEVIAEAGDADTARRRASGLKPGVLVLDLNMPGEPSLAMIPAIREGSPDTAVVVLTMQDDPAFAREAFRLGARAFVVKHAAGAELVDAIRAASRGETYINPILGARLAAEPEGPPGGLTPREVEVLRLVAAGYTNPEIAEQLVISIRTVETHRAAIHRKLDTTSRAEAVAFARDHGLLEGQ